MSGGFVRAVSPDNLSCAEASRLTSPLVSKGLISMTKYIAKFQSRMAERGATAVEYGLMVALIAIVIIVAVALLGGNLSGLFNRVAQSV